MTPERADDRERMEDRRASERSGGVYPEDMAAADLETMRGLACRINGLWQMYHCIVVSALSGSRTGPVEDAMAELEATIGGLNKAIMDHLDDHGDAGFENSARSDTQAAIRLGETIRGEG